MLAQPLQDMHDRHAGTICLQRRVKRNPSPSQWLGGFSGWGGVDEQSKLIHSTRMSGDGAGRRKRKALRRGVFSKKQLYNENRGDAARELTPAKKQHLKGGTSRELEKSNRGNKVKRKAGGWFSPELWEALPLICQESLFLPLLLTEPGTPPQLLGSLRRSPSGHSGPGGLVLGGRDVCGNC